MQKLLNFRAVRKQDGYALVEIIMAIGILAIVGLYVVEMFVLAATTQSKARDLDSACLLAQTTVEDARSGDVFLGEKYYSDKWLEIPDRRDDGFTLSASITDPSLNKYTVSIYKNGEYFRFADDNESSGDPLFSLGVTLTGEVAFN